MANSRTIPRYHTAKYRLRNTWYEDPTPLAAYVETEGEARRIIEDPENMVTALQERRKKKSNYYLEQILMSPLLPCETYASSSDFDVTGQVEREKAKPPEKREYQGPTDFQTFSPTFLDYMMIWPMGQCPSHAWEIEFRRLREKLWFMRGTKAGHSYSRRILGDLEKVMFSTVDRSMSYAETFVYMIYKAFPPKIPVTPE
jgi:hypothetical protein